MGVIYKATCIITGKSYIGQTKRSLEKRKHQHENSSDTYYFHRALKKYGKENFEWVILEECDNTELDTREKYWIQFYNTYEKGYNSTLGGDNANALEEWRKKNPQKAKENALKNLFYANEANKKNKEKHLLQLASARQKGIEKVKKKVKCIELHLIFNSLADAERWSLSQKNPNGKKASHQHISHVCKGSRKTAGGYHWQYV